MAACDDNLHSLQNLVIYSNDTAKITETQPGILFKYSWTTQLEHNLNNQIVKSPEFSSRGHSGITWFLTLHYFYKDGYAYSRIKVQLSLTSSNVQEVTAEYWFSLLDDRGSVIRNSTKAPNTIFKLSKPPNTSDFIELYPYNSIPTGNITIECKITVPFSQVHPEHKNEQKLDFQFTEKLLTMFENEEFCDVTFSVNGNEFKAHKVILAAGSSVFKVMFEHDMMEKKHNRVEITDIDIEVLRELVRFIYTKKVSNLKKIAKELLVAADKYDLEKLRNKCESVLCKNVSTENVAEMFIFADTYNAVFLKTKAKDYIVGYSKDVSDTAGWKSMVMTHPHLLAEAFIALSNK